MRPKIGGYMGNGKPCLPHLSRLKLSAEVTLSMWGWMHTIVSLRILHLIPIGQPGDLWGPVQDENAETLVQKPGKKLCTFSASLSLQICCHVICHLRLFFFRPKNTPKVSSHVLSHMGLCPVFSMWGVLCAQPSSSLCPHPGVGVGGDTGWGRGGE